MINGLISKERVREIIETACKVIVDKGITTRNEHLLHRAAKNEYLTVRNQRIYPSRQIINLCLEQLKKSKLPQQDKPVNLHGWQDMIVNKGDDRNLIIKLTDLPYQYCDHQSRKIVPLTRHHVVEGTKLLHVLSHAKNIKGYSCGVPQDTHSHLKAIEQYLIGFRYNQNGGGTIQSVPLEVKASFSGIRSIAEEWANPNERDLMLFSPSPMILDSDELYLCFEKDTILRSFIVGSMPMMGMTGPVDPVGSYVLGLAEVIGAASILHAIFPDAMAFVYPHPQAMSLSSGQMAFGTIEHARLEQLKKRFMDGLELPYYNLKDIMTSAQMPGSMAQGDKALGFYSGLAAGYRAFNLMPLSTDQVWSPVQALLDIEYLQNAWKVADPSMILGNPDESYQTIGEVIDQNCLFAETGHTLMNMFENYDLDSVQKRYFTSETWAEAGSVDELTAVEEKKEELISLWDYRPPQEKLESIFDIYISLCKKYNTPPLNFD